jgi:hypothetical protein
MRVAPEAQIVRAPAPMPLPFRSRIASVASSNGGIF